MGVALEGSDYPLEDPGRGVLIFGTNGSALLDGNNYTIFDAKRQVVRDVRRRDTQADRANTLSSTGLALDQLHVKNFIEAVRTGTPPSDPVEEGLGLVRGQLERARHAQADLLSFLRFPRRRTSGPYKKTARRAQRVGPVEILPAATYSPTESPLQYHRR